MRIEVTGCEGPGGGMQGCRGKRGQDLSKAREFGGGLEEGNQRKDRIDGRGSRIISGCGEFGSRRI